MNEGKVLEIGTKAMEMILLIGGPILVVALTIGVLVSIFQAATQVNEPTLSFLPKMAAIFGTIFILGQWMLSTLSEYIITLYGSIPTLLH